MSDSAPERTPLSHLRHDLRTPLNQIIGYSELLDEEAEDAGHEDYRPDLHRINQAARTLLGLINDNLTDDRLSLTGEFEHDAAEETKPPASTPAAPVSGSPPAATAPPPAEQTGHILVVDDQEANRDMLARQLQRQGHTTATAGDGREALAALRDGAFDLVLLDMIMPELDGHSTLLEIKRDPKLRDLPVIMISALDELDSVVRCIQSGAEDYLPKPANPTLLSARIGAGLDKKRFRDQEQRYVRQIEETQERLRQELAEAENYVRSILPPPGKTRGIPTSWSFVPSTELGGDSFGHHWIDDDHLAMYLLDVCGHGVAAALLSVTAINVLRAAALPGVDFRDPGGTLEALNEAFLMEKQNDMYFTIWYGVWHVPTRTLRFASAGHPPSLLIPADRSGGQPIDLLKGAGLVLGGMEGMTYKTFERAIPEKAAVVLICDGVFEIEREDGTMWDQPGLVEWFAARAPEEAAKDFEDLYDYVRRMNGPGPLDDDFSLLRLEL